MKLYNRDYNILTDEELKKWEALKKEVEYANDGRKLSFKKVIHHKLPVFVNRKVVHLLIENWSTVENNYLVFSSHSLVSCIL